VCIRNSCFTAGTLISMADGTSRPIERTRVGDLVVGGNGRINRVVEIEQPVLGTRRLYALNEGDFFVTAEHPFMTDDGWKSIDPVALASEGSSLAASRLAVGDRVLTITGVATPVAAGSVGSGDAVDMRRDGMQITRIRDQRADPETPLYNLRLDGDHTYFANGLLVHNK